MPHRSFLFRLFGKIFGIKWVAGTSDYLKGDEYAPYLALSGAVADWNKSLMNVL
jgi:hypothetical protein